MSQTLDSMILRDWRLFKRNPKGLIGLEFECEGTGLIPWSDDHWEAKTDNSLRNGFEYVLKVPVAEKTLDTVIDSFFSMSKGFNTKFKESLRTSIHVHLNVQNRTLLQIYNIITLYWLVEKLLVRWCGSTREGNLFCLRVSDADYILSALQDGLEDGRLFNSVSSDDFKYAALNLQTLTTFGSLEFRSLRGNYDNPDNIKLWVQQLITMSKACDIFSDPKEILQFYKISSPLQFLSKFFSPTFVHQLLAISPNAAQDLEDHFHFAFRLAHTIDNWKTLDCKVKPKKKMTWTDIDEEEQGPMDQFTTLDTPQIWPSDLDEAT